MLYSTIQIILIYKLFRFVRVYGNTAKTALPYSMDSEFSKVLQNQMVRMYSVHYYCKPYLSVIVTLNCMVYTVLYQKPKSLVVWVGET